MDFLRNDLLNFLLYLILSASLWFISLYSVLLGSFCLIRNFMFLIMTRQEWCYPLFLYLLCWIFSLIVLQCNMQEGMEGNPVAGTMKNVSRVFAVLTVPFTMGFPKVNFSSLAAQGGNNFPSLQPVCALEVILCLLLLKASSSVFISSTKVGCIWCILLFYY